MTLDLARKVLSIESRAIANLIDRIDSSFENAVELIINCKGRVVVTGIGKSGIICRKIAATLNSSGNPSFYLLPAEALHGDLGMVVQSEVVNAVSNSGETEEILQLLEPTKRLSIPLISFLGRMDSTLAQSSDVTLDVSVDEEACPMGLAPTASTTASLALGDALAMAVLEKRGFTAEDFAGLHPRGQLGAKLMRVENLMHSGQEIPVVHEDAFMADAIYEMSSKALGVTSVVDHSGTLVGLISDGDLRRQLQKDHQILSKTAGQCMTPNPKTIDRRELATRALAIMEEMKITSLLVPDDNGGVAGIIHLHDLWRLGSYF